MNQQAPASFEIHSEARGPHWVAWISRPGERVPYQSILLVGETRESAEAKAREWARRAVAQAARLGSDSSSSGR
jgi:hypothetical protein